MIARHPAAIPPARALVAPLTAADLPPGYRCIAAPTGSGEAGTSVRSRAACRWLPPAGAPASAPLAVDVTVTAFARRADALSALTAAPDLPDGLEVRTLFPPRIGDGTAAVRADIAEAGTRYVLYRVDVQVGRSLATIAATWRWPAGSPVWVYERARRLVQRLSMPAE